MLTQQFMPHSSTSFEGHYSKFDLPSGASAVLVICTVKNAKSKPHMVSFTYVPEGSSDVFQRELWVEKINWVGITAGSRKGFKIDIPGVGYMKSMQNSVTHYWLNHDDFSLHAKTSSRVPWPNRQETPEGLLTYLPLPLHWHVQSLRSDCALELKIPSMANLPPEDRYCKAKVHEEKNWGKSFPVSHVWIQARREERGFCCAGGRTLGMEAYLASYTSPGLTVNFAPPFALKIFWLSPFMSAKVNWEQRTVQLHLQGLMTKLEVVAVAPKGAFFPLGAPFHEGHREKFLAQSFQTAVEVRISKRSWLGKWELVHKDLLDNASLEFGGENYPLRGDAPSGEEKDKVT